jgi:integrase/recombinase XerD
VRGKGDYIRTAAASDQRIAELKHYRVALGLPPLPHPGDRTPAVLPILGPSEFLSRHAVYDLVKDVPADASARVRAQGPQRETAAARHPNWLRYTAASTLTKKVGIIATRDSLGHANVSTTSIYLHVGDEKRHDAVNEHHAITWSA